MGNPLDPDYHYAGMPSLFGRLANAIRWNDWKVGFATLKGSIGTANRDVPAWANITNLRMDPNERAAEEGGLYAQDAGQQMRLLVPIQPKVKAFFSDFDQYPFQTGSSLNAGNIGYGMLQEETALKRLKELESLTPK